MRSFVLALLSFACVAFSAGCGACPAPVSVTPQPEGDARVAIEAVLDDWHEAAAASDGDRYFGHFTGDAIFLGTDATERWTVAEFRAYAERPFAEGRGWRMRAVRRAVIVRGDVAWVDEDLDAPNLGPSRGRAVLVRGDDGTWRIAHYDLALTIPNERLVEIRDLLRASATPASDLAQ